MAEYDLTQTLLAYMDPHLGLPLLSHLRSLSIFDAKDLAKAQYELGKKTNMVDYTMQFFREAYPGEDEPKDVAERANQLEVKNNHLAKEAEHVLTVIEDPNVAGALKQDKAQNLEWLKQQYKLTTDQINVLYEYGRFLFSCGKYSEASSYLYHFCILSPDTKLYESVLWGKLACDTLTGDWDRAMDDVRVLREYIDAQRATTSVVSASEERRISHEDILQKRVWLLHWSLFVFFNHPNGRFKLVEMFLSPTYLSTIQMSCWWLLRYLVIALVVTRRQATRGYLIEGTGYSQTTKLTAQAALREVSKDIQIEAYRLQPDPFIDFFRQLYVELDFECAQAELAKAESVVRHDFFLQDVADPFIEHARLLVSEVYCRIHQKVDIVDLSKRLNMSKEDGEKWIVKLICDTKMDAKIDLKEGVVRMNQPRPIVYQSVIDKTRGITFRTSALAQAMDRRAHPPAATSDAAQRRPRKNETRSDADSHADADGNATNAQAQSRTLAAGATSAPAATAESA
jgi:eukaryotic translation initiation factor 3 subunit E